MPRLFYMHGIYFMWSWLLGLCLMLTSCHSSSSQAPVSWQQIAARDEGEKRPIIYRVKVPLHWTRKDPDVSESLSDTTKALCEFYLEEGGESIRITLHNFPPLQTRIPPLAQIQRWKNQFEDLDLSSTYVESVSQSGFTGLFLEGQGLCQGAPMKILGWSMQLAPEYYRQLGQEKDLLSRQTCADYTIKALGPPHLMDKHRKAIMAFANSFQLIDELPYSL